MAVMAGCVPQRLKCFSRARGEPVVQDRGRRCLSGWRGGGGREGP